MSAEQRRPSFVLLVEHEDGEYQAVGPFSDREAAYDWFDKQGWSNMYERGTLEIIGRRAFARSAQE